MESLNLLSQQSAILLILSLSFIFVLFGIIYSNKFKGIRAVICWNKEIAKLAKQHNNANIICIPSRFIKTEEAL